MQAEAGMVAHVKATQRIIKFMESSDREHAVEAPPPVSHPVTSMTHNYYQTSPSDMPQDMSINNLTYNNSANYSSSGSDRMSSSMELDNYHWRYDNQLFMPDFYAPGYVHNLGF